MQPEIILFVIIFLYGIVLGSFLNVLIYRLPLKENIVTNRSHCMRCGKQIQWYDLVPLVSYIILRGKCRNCGDEISVQYPLIEAMNGVGYVLIFTVSGFTLLSILNCFLFSILIVIAVIDWRTFEIPFSLNISIGVLAVLRIIMDISNLLDALIGFCVISGFLMIIFFITKGNGIGGGDIKLMAAAGLYLGWKNIMLAFVVGCILGAIIHLILMKVYNKNHMLAFGPYLSAGIFITILYGDKIIAWYLKYLSI